MSGLLAARRSGNGGDKTYALTYTGGLCGRGLDPTRERAQREDDRELVRCSRA